MTVNPYIIGRPIHEKNKFFGRETLFASIEDNLNNGTQIILLHGQRRIGKSSVLKLIPNFIQLEDFIFVQFDLQHHENNSLAKILEELSTEIVCQTNSKTEIIPNLNNLEDNPWSAFSRRFLPNLYQEINHQNLVILIDEFDVIGNHSRNESHQSHFYPYIQKLLSDERQLFIIPVIGRYPNELPRLRTLFRAAPFQEIGLLDEIGTNNLIIKPAEGRLTYQDGTIKEILKLSAGHPFFTQAICSALFFQARDNNNWIVSPSDVKPILNQAIQNVESGLNGNWDILNISEKVIVSAIAEVTVKEPEFEKYSEEQLFAFLNKNGVVKTNYLVEAVEKLSKNVCYYEKGGYSIRAKLIQYWLLKNHQLKDEIPELEKIAEGHINNLIEAAEHGREEGRNEQVTRLYQEALEINQNNFKIVLILVEEYLQKKDFAKACELAKRFYQADPLHHKTEYLHVLSVYGHHLISNGEFSLAKQQYQEILEIEPNRISAKERLEEIDVYEQRLNRNIPNPPTNPPKPIRGSRLNLILAITTILGLSVLGIGHNQFFPCAEGERKEWLFFCQANSTRISNGDRTIFPGIKNPRRDEGIKAFKQDKYQDATKLFEEAVAANRNDPEVLIYYNNARARQSGEPFSLAVVVPADNNDKDNLNVAKEMLRGVAQSQQQFNDQGGLNGRLLEIVIANDAGKPEQAKEVAAELIKNQSILGIIGHHSSESTKAALEEYNKTDIPVISPTSTSIFLEGNNFFRGLPSDTASAETLAVHAFEKLNIKKIAIYYNDSPFSNSMREEFTKKFENLGGEIVRRIPIDGTQLDRNTADTIVARSVFRDNAEAALLCPDARHINNALKIAQANKELLDRTSGRRGFKHLLGCDTLYGSNILSKGGDAIEGLITVVPWFRETSEESNFAQEAESQWGGGVSWVTATSFDATEAFLQALSSNSTRSTVITKLKNVNISANDTSGYEFKFNAERERKTEPILVEIKNKKFTPIR